MTKDLYLVESTREPEWYTRKPKRYTRGTLENLSGRLESVPIKCLIKRSIKDLVEIRLEMRR